MVKIYIDKTSFFFPGMGGTGFGYASWPLTYHDVLTESVAAYSHRSGKWVKYKWDACKPEVLEELFFLRKEDGYTSASSTTE